MITNSLSFANSELTFSSNLRLNNWIRLLRRSGFEVEDLIEVRPAVGAISRYPFVTVEWARQVAVRRGVESAQNALNKNNDHPGARSELRSVAVHRDWLQFDCALNLL